jgi:hypothetical protein
MFTLSRALAALVLSIGVAHAQTTTLKFETHAAFFSNETNQVRALDPQVFVADRGSHGGPGPQSIRHVAGFRNAFVDEGENRPLFNAAGKRIDLTAGQWFGATGTVNLSPEPDGTEAIDISLKGLKPGALYSLFENHFDHSPISFTPLDGAAQSNSFRANAHGEAAVHVVAPHVLTHDNAVLVVLHSDDVSHGQERGDIGVDAHHQLIVRVP